MLTLLVPLLIILSPLLGQILLSKKFSDSSIKTLVIIGVSFFIVGLFTPVLATMVSIYGFMHTSRSTDCLSGVVIFIILGYIVTIVIVPSSIYFIQNKKVMDEIRKRSY